jgi:phosphoserine phosphatase
MDREIKTNPDIVMTEPFKSYIEKGPAFMHDIDEKELMKLLILTHTGSTEKEFEDNVKNFVATARLPKRNVPLSQARYQPQMELLKYLEDHKFSVFICTGGTVEFVRGISQEFYGVPKYRVIGTTFKYDYDAATNAILRKPELSHFNDKAGKPVGIQEFIGQRPVIACGNEGGAGDIEMLKFCQGSKYKSMQLLVNHDDSNREVFYQEVDNASLTAATKYGWHIISIKNDWKIIYTK